LKHRKFRDAQLGGLSQVIKIVWLERSIVLTPYGVNEILSAAPVQFGFIGGDAANVSPPMAHAIGQARTLILKGGFPESKIGDGKLEGCSPG